MTYLNKAEEFFWESLDDGSAPARLRLKNTAFLYEIPESLFRWQDIFVHVVFHLFLSGTSHHKRIHYVTCE